MFERLSRELGDTDGRKKRDFIFISEICCEFLPCLLSLAEHLILVSCDASGSVKSFSPTELEHNTSFFFFTLTAGGNSPSANDMQHFWQAGRAGTRRASRLTDVDNSILGASECRALKEVGLGMCIMSAVFLLAVTIHLTETLRSIPQWAERVAAAKMLDASASRRDAADHLKGETARLDCGCIILACDFPFFLFGFGSFWVDMNEMP